MSNDKENIFVEFEDSLGEDDYGLIVCGKTGTLKGLWIPSGKENDKVPETVVDVCIDYFGINPNEDDQGATLH